MNSDDGNRHESGIHHSVYLPVRLVCISGALQGQVFEAWGDQLVFGREFSNDVVLPDEATSKVHARIVCEDGVYFLEDLNSVNGSHLQGRKVERERLQSGHLIGIGVSSFRFETVIPGPTFQPRRWIQVGATVLIGACLAYLIAWVLSK